jgi:WD40 repeat protein
VPLHRHFMRPLSNSVEHFRTNPSSGRHTLIRARDPQAMLAWRLPGVTSTGQRCWLSPVAAERPRWQPGVEQSPGLESALDRASPQFLWGRTTPCWPSPPLIRRVRIWDFAAGALCRRLGRRWLRHGAGHTGLVNSVCAVSVDGQDRLTSASDDRTVQVWDPPPAPYSFISRYTHANALFAFADDMIIGLHAGILTIHLPSTSGRSCDPAMQPSLSKINKYVCLRQNSRSRRIGRVRPTSVDMCRRTRHQWMQDCTGSCVPSREAGPSP